MCDRPRVTEQPFDFPFFQETADPVFERVSPTPRVFTPEEFATMSYSGSGDVTAPLQAVDVVVPVGANPPNTSTSGCEAADFAGFTPGNVALMQRGTCSFRIKSASSRTSPGATSRRTRCARARSTIGSWSATSPARA